MLSENQGWDLSGNLQVIDTKKDATITAASSRNSNLFFLACTHTHTRERGLGWMREWLCSMGNQGVILDKVCFCPYLVLTMYSITFHPVCIASNRRRDGTIPVKIRITFKGVSRRIPTTLVARPGDLTRTLHIKNPDILNKANDLIKRMQESLSGVTFFELEEWDIDRVIGHIKGKMKGESFKLDFFEWADSYLKCKTDTTRRAYDMALGGLERYLGKREIDVNEITKTLLVGFVEYIDNEKKVSWQKGRWVEGEKPKSKGQSSLLLMKLAHIFNAAKVKYNDDDRILIPRSPFENIPRVYPVSRGQNALSCERIRELWGLELDGMERVAVDVFLLSFGAMGANMADLYPAKKFSGDWVYHRKKTQTRRKDGAEMRVVIQPELLAICERLKGKGDWWLGELHRFKNTDMCTQKVNQSLKRVAERMGWEDFTFYAARHSWATIARNRCKIEKSLIDECLAHKGDFSLTDIYIEKSWDLVNEANRRVLDTIFEK